MQMNNELYGYALVISNDALCHHGVKGQKWGVRRNLDGSVYSSGSSSRTQTKERHISKKVKVGAAVAASVLAAYGVHKVINNPEVISAGKNAVSKMMSTMDTGKLSESVKSSTEYKLAKGAAKAAKPIVSTTGKVIKKIGSDDTTKTITGIGTMAGTAALLKQQRNELRDIKKTEGTNFDKTVKYIQKTSDMGANVSNLAKGPKGQPAGVNNSQNGNKNNSNSNPLLKKTRDLKSVVGDPKGMFGAEDEKNYQNLFRNNPTDDQRALIKAMRKNGYSVDQIKSYVYHSAIRRNYRMNYRMNYGDELYHHGVKGMKWGVHKARNYYDTQPSAVRKKAARDKYDRSVDNAETRHENRARALEAKYKGRSKTGDTIRFRDKHAYKVELKKSFKQYEKDFDLAKSEYAFDKKMNKKLNYRDKLANRANSKAEGNAKMAKEHDNVIRDLQKNGTKSAAYREHWDTTQKVNKAAYELKHPGQDYNSSAQRFVDMLNQSVNADKTVATLIASNKYDRDSYSRAGKKYTEANSRLMNMPITPETTKKDIRKTYRGR